MYYKEKKHFDFLNYFMQIEMRNGNNSLWNRANKKKALKNFQSLSAARRGFEPLLPG